MKVIKNTRWNRIFHNKQIMECTNKYLTAKFIIQEAPKLLNQVRGSKSLLDLLELHKKIVSLGFKSAILYSNYYFKNEDIESLTPHQVMLGSIFGLNTFAISYWEANINEPYGVNGFGIREDYPMYDLILSQYKGILANGINSEINNSQTLIQQFKNKNYERLQKLN